MMITGAWLGLEDRVAEEFAKSGIERERSRFTHAVRMQYYGQLNDIEIVSPHAELEEAEQLDDLIDEFEEAYGKVYARSARSPELGYLVTHAIVTARSRSRSRRCPTSASARERRRRRDAPGLGGATATPTPTSTSSTDVRRATRSPGRRSSSRSPPRSRSRPGAVARLDRHQIFHLTAED